MTYAPRTEQFRTPRGRAVSCLVRDGTNDWNTANATLTEDEYGLRDLPEMTGVALDIGAYLGTVAIALALDNPGLRVIAVEPVPANVALIVDNIGLNGVGDRVTVIHGAVGTGPGRMTIHHGYHGSESAEHHAFVGNVSFIQGSSPEACPSQVPHEHTEVSSFGLADIVDEMAVSFVKIDCEGGEWAFLAGAGDALGQVERMHGEWHPTSGHTQDDLVAAMPAHRLEFSGPTAGPGGFRAVRA